MDYLAIHYSKIKYTIHKKDTTARAVYGIPVNDVNYRTLYRMEGSYINT